MKPSEKCYEIIKQFEGCRLKAYKDSAGVWTVGYGTIMYPNGIKVKEGDICTQDEAVTFLKYEVILKSQSVNAFTSNYNLTQNQFDALVSFAYNLGVGALQKSALLKKIKHNPNDPSIEVEFMKWVNAGGKKIKGLVKRRQQEATLYFTP